jgi:hypothetical protein
VKVSTRRQYRSKLIGYKKLGSTDFADFFTKTTGFVNPNCDMNFSTTLAVVCVCRYETQSLQTCFSDAKFSGMFAIKLSALQIIISNSLSYSLRVTLCHDPAAAYHISPLNRLRFGATTHPITASPSFFGSLPAAKTPPPPPPMVGLGQPTGVAPPQDHHCKEILIL